jgi:hypothetical protein
MSNLPPDMKPVLIWIKGVPNFLTGYYDSTCKQWRMWDDIGDEWIDTDNVEDWTSNEDARNARNMREDIDHALSQAKERLPDYPWSQNTMSEVVWALAGAHEGVSLANDELHAAIRKAVTALVGDDLAKLIWQNPTEPSKKE